MTSLASLKCVINLFADDACIYRSGSSIPQVVSMVSEDLSRTVQWFKQNKLSLNVSKTKWLLIPRPQSGLMDMCASESLSEVRIC